LVPPWNRIAAALIPRLSDLGFAGLSTFTPRNAAEPAPGLWQINSHVDLIDWRNGRRFIGEVDAAARMAEVLGAQRLSATDPDEPTGLLSHHLVMPDEAWGFLSTLFALTNEHPGVRWCAPAIG
jgi:hypothetical protein